MQRLTIWAALVVISLASATSAHAFHHGRRGCGYGYGCGYGGYGGCGYGGCGYGYGGGYYGGWYGGYGGWGGYPMWGYAGGYPLYATMSPSPYSGVAYSAARTPAANGFVAPIYNAAPAYPIANPAYSPLRPATTPAVAPQSATRGVTPQNAARGTTSQTSATGVAKPAATPISAAVQPVVPAANTAMVRRP